MVSEIMSVVKWNIWEYQWISEFPYELAETFWLMNQPLILWSLIAEKWMILIAAMLIMNRKTTLTKTRVLFKISAQYSVATVGPTQTLLPGNEPSDYFPFMVEESVHYVEYIIRKLIEFFLVVLKTAVCMKLHHTTFSEICR